MALSTQNMELTTILTSAQTISCFSRHEQIDGISLRPGGMSTPVRKTWENRPALYNATVCPIQAQ